MKLPHAKSPERIPENRDALCGTQLAKPFPPHAGFATVQACNGHSPPAPAHSHSKELPSAPCDGIAIATEPVKCEATERSAQRIRRKLGLLKRTGLFATQIPGIAVEQARTADELRAAYRLVHDVYVERGYCSEMDWGMRLRVFEASSEMATFVAKLKDGTIVGVLSVVADCDPFGLPSDGVFAAEISEFRRADFKLCEVTNQAIEATYRKSALSTELMRCAMAHGITMGYQKAIATVSPGHTSFYNLLNFTEIGPQRSYSQTINDPVIALCGDLDFYRACPEQLDEVASFIHRFMTTDNHFFKRVGEWHKEATASFLDADLLRSLFTSWSSFLESCSESEIAFLEHKWGWNLFDEVTEPRVEESIWAKRKTSWTGGFCPQHLSECWPSFGNLLPAS